MNNKGEYDVEIFINFLLLVKCSPDEKEIKLVWSAPRICICG